MKKIVFLIFGFLLLSVFSYSVIADNSNSNKNGNLVIGSNVQNKVVVNNNGEEVQVQIQERETLRSRNVTAHTDLEIESNMTQNRTRLQVHLSNGRNAEIKIMPDTASERAIERLRLKVCNESNNCTIELKEVGQGNETRLNYELQAERYFRILGIFQAKAKVRAEINAENGDVSVKNPWWAFLATKD